MDPCFPCLHEFSIWTGEPKEKYDRWTDETMSWEEIKAEHERQQAEMKAIFDTDPELQALVKKVADSIKRRSSV